MAIVVNRKPTVREFVMKADPSGETRVTIKQATQREVEKRADLFANATQVISLEDKKGERDVMRYEQQFNSHRQAAYETKLVLISAIGFEDESGDPIFITRPDKEFGSVITMGEAEVLKALGLLTPELFAEIHGYVLEMNPIFAGKKSVGESSDT